MENQDFWHPNYFHDNYWHDYFWAEEATPPPVVTNRITPVTFLNAQPAAVSGEGTVS